MELFRILKDIATGALPIQDIPDFLSEQNLLGQFAIVCMSVAIIGGVIIGAARIH